jgi:hypothetical protein
LYVDANKITIKYDRTEVEKIISFEEDEKTYKEALRSLQHQLKDFKGLVVSDDVAHVHAQLLKAAIQACEKFEKELTISSFV